MRSEVWGRYWQVGRSLSHADGAFPCRMVHDTDIIELELKSKKFNLSLRKKEALQSEQPVIQVCM